jgi:galactokinase
MDQTACAVGGFITIDFADPKDPVVRKFEKTLSDYGYSLCIVDTGGNHADLTPDYASVPAEMKTVARLMGKDVLRDVDEAEFVENIPVLREKAGDRAVLRAIHFFNENKRVDSIVSAFDEGNIEKFFGRIYIHTKTMAHNFIITIKIINNSHTITFAATMR